MIVDDGALRELREGVGDDAIFRDLVREFLVDAPRSLAEGRAAAHARDLERTQRVFHTLKSTAATFGAMDLSEACRVLEHAARAGTVPSDAELGAADAAFAAARDVIARELA
jgi:HPt (histidine-containing phosphotransfer) domain-containing protein